MNQKIAIPFTLILLATLIFTACSQPTANSTPSLDDAVQTAIAATAAFNAAVDQAVQATITALPPTPTPQPQPDVYELSEEELAALIDEAVNEAVAASEETYAATSESTADGTVSEDELYDAIYYLYDAEAAIAYAEELIYAYYDLYGEYISEALDLLYLIEEDLSNMASDMEEIASLLEQGAEAATAAIEQLNAAADQAIAHLEEIQSQAEGWVEKVQSSLQGREQEFLNLAPNDIAGNRNDAIHQVYTYLDAVKSAMGDKKIGRDEMQNIAQLGANAQASIQAQGGPGLQNLLGSISGLTSQLAKGQWPQARGGLGGFEASLPARPRR
jgi:DNA repair exonuclease SbcCD ATPase subunit